MADKPILFNGSMVRGILDDIKTNTRRIVKGSEDCEGIDQVRDRKGVFYRGWWSSNGATQSIDFVPQVEVGDTLWVRESWRTSQPWDDMNATQIAQRAIEAGYSATPKHPPCGLWYEADGTYRRWGSIDNEPGRYRHARFMPRWASRITLKVTNVRIEHLQDMNRGDAMAEGCPFPNMAKGPNPLDWFRELWDGINGKGSWASNPWVWVYEFKREKQP